MQRQPSEWIRPRRNSLRVLMDDGPLPTGELNLATGLLAAPVLGEALKPLPRGAVHDREPSVVAVTAAHAPVGYE